MDHLVPSIQHASPECHIVWKHEKLTSGSAKDRNFYGGRSQRRFNLDCSRTEPTQRHLREESTPTYSLDIINSSPGSGFLQFWTVSLTLRLDKSRSSEKIIGPSHTRCQLGIFGRSGRELGTISVQNPWFEQNPAPQEREFILICEGRDKRAKHGRVDEEEGWRYMAMLIDWHGEEYAERVAIGSIGKGDLKEALGNGPCWKEIILG